MLVTTLLNANISFLFSGSNHTRNLKIYQYHLKQLDLDRKWVAWQVCLDSQAPQLNDCLVGNKVLDFCLPCLWAGVKVSNFSFLLLVTQQLTPNQSPFPVLTAWKSKILSKETHCGSLWNFISIRPCTSPICNCAFLHWKVLQGKNKFVKVFWSNKSL